jgi:hypothetical protein
MVSARQLMEIGLRCACHAVARAFVLLLLIALFHHVAVAALMARFGNMDFSDRKSADFSPVLISLKGADVDLS